MQRRAFTEALLKSITSYALFRTLTVHEAFGKAIAPITDGWIRTLHEMAQDLKTARITPRMWQEQIASLYARVPRTDLLHKIDFERLTKGFAYPDLGVHTRTVRFPELAGLPPNLGFHSKVFGMQRNRAIIPHGHRNMVSCHYVLQGDLHLRHYNKVQEEAQHMILEPTVDAVVEPGSYSSISDEHNNVHWLRALSPTAFTFDVIVLDLNGQTWEVDNIDPYAAEKLAGGLIRAPKLDVETALEKYGHDTHH